MSLLQPLALCVCSWVILSSLCAVLGAPPTPRIDWNQSTLTLVQADAHYGRMARLKDRSILCVYESRGGIWACRSRDNGRTWGNGMSVATYPFGIAANPEVLPLRNGWVLCAYNERPRDGLHPFTIRTCFSRDGGVTWQAPATAYTADTRFENGCWEPALIQLPSGEIRLYFANENPYRASTEQEITMLRSRDNAATWSAPERVSFRAGHRDGMPVPIILRGGKEIVMAIEDNGLNGNFKPSIVSMPVTGGPSQRWGALRTPLPDSTYAGAPYLRQMPSGETVLSAQVSPDGDLGHAQMVVYVGSDRARDFGSPSMPFSLPPETAGLWNSLFVKDGSTITALSSTTVRGVRGLWSIDGHMHRAKP